MINLEEQVTSQRRVHIETRNLNLVQISSFGIVIQFGFATISKNTNGTKLQDKRFGLNNKDTKTVENVKNTKLVITTMLKH